MNKVMVVSIAVVLTMLLNTSCKKESAEPADTFEGEWFIKTKRGTSEIYLQQQSSGIYTGIGAWVSKSKIKFVKAEAGKYFITINNIPNKVLDANQPVLYTFLVFTEKASSNTNSQLFSI